MKHTRFTLFCLVAALMPLLANAQQKAEVKTNGTTTEVTFYTPEIVRVVKYPSDARPPAKKSYVVTLTPQADLKVGLKESGAKTTLTSSALTVTIDKRTGLVQFLAKGKNLLKEKSYGFEPRTSGPDKGSFRTTIVYQLDKDEPIYGLGAIQDGKMNRRNSTHRMMEQSNLQDYQYVIQSLKGWGLFWDNYSRADFIDNAEGMTFSAEVGDEIDYYFMLGAAGDELNAQMRTLSGKVPMFPLWTFGYWQCRERYKTPEELLEVVHWHRANGVPLDGIIQDWQYWGNNYLWNAMDFLGEPYHRGKEMVEEVHRQNAHLMISIWASFGPQTHAFKQLEEKGLLYDFETWPQSGLSHIWPPRRDYPSGVRVYDALSPAAREIYWKSLQKLVDYNIDAWWMDSTDPDHMDYQDSDLDEMTAMGSWRSVRNLFPFFAVGGVDQHQRAVDSTKRVFILTRSYFAGQQRYGANTWSGDVGSSWENLRRQIPICLNYTLTANPNTNTDIGGFFARSYNTQGHNSATRNPQYQELYVRWMQYGAFTPMMRSHGTDVYREIYYYGKPGEPVYDALVDAIKLRYRLMPYTYSLSWQVSQNDDSFMRPLIMDFKNDKNTWNMGDEYMYGRSILVCPVGHPLYTRERIVKTDELSGWNKNEATGELYRPVDWKQMKTYEVYLPAGCKWYDYWTNNTYEGGQNVKANAPLAYSPLYVKAGSIIPVGPEVQYTSEKPWDNLDIKVYPGANAEFTLYEDEGDNYNYQKGMFSTITFKWNDKSKTLTVDRRKGDFPGMLKERKFNIKVAGGAEKTVTYNGKRLSVKM